MSLAWRLFHRLSSSVSSNSLQSNSGRGGWTCCRQLRDFPKKDHYRERFFSQFVASGVIGCFIQTRWILARQDSTKKFDLGHSKNVGTWCIQGVDLRWHLFPEKIQMLLTGESEFFHPAPSPANLNLNLSLEFNSTTDVNVAYEVIIILTNDENKLS